MVSKVKLPSNSEFVQNYLPISAFILSMPDPLRKCSNKLRPSKNGFKSEAPLKPKKTTRLPLQFSVQTLTASETWSWGLPGEL